MNHGNEYLWIFSMDLPFCHPCGSHNLDAPPRVLQNLFTLISHENNGGV